MDIVIRSVIIYLFIVVGIRIFGKGELTQLSVVELVFILLISNSVQNAMVGDDSSLWGGVIAAISLFVVNFVLETLFFKSKKISKLFQGSPVMLVYKGQALKKHLQDAKISMDQLEQSAREHGVKDIKDVDLAILEIDGNISVISGKNKEESSSKDATSKNP